MTAEPNQTVQQTLDRLIAETSEIGLQVAAYLDGELVVDVWGGLADEPSGRAVDRDTVFCVFSATKGIASTALHLQAERGHIDYDTPVAEYWPEFAVHGKDRVTVGEALQHRAGVPQVPEGTTPESMCDWEHMVAETAALEPLWEPGTQSGYHAYTFGWIIGELVVRTDPQHRPFGQFVQEEICAPLGIDSLWLGIPDEVEPRVATIANVPAPPPDMPIQLPPFFRLAIPEHLDTNQETFGRPDVRRSCHPGAGGIMNARSLARHYALLAGRGEVEGTRLLSAERVDQMRELHTDEPDAVIGAVYRRGLGYWLGGDLENGTVAAMGANPRALGHPGAGGSLGWADPETGLAVAVVKNRMLGGSATPQDNPVTILGNAVRHALGLDT